MYELVVVDVVVFFFFFIEDVSISWYCYIYTQGKKNKTKQNKKQRTDFGFQGFLNRLCSCIS